MIAGPVFVDTTHWIAAFSHKDNNHARAIAIGAPMANAEQWTSELVLTEFLAHLSRRGTRRRALAAQAVDALREHPKVRIVTLAEVPFDAAFGEYKRYADKDWSLVDCASFLIMRQNTIPAAVAYDAHFQQAGFAVVP